MQELKDNARVKDPITRKTYFAGDLKSVRRYFKVAFAQYSAAAILTPAIIEFSTKGINLPLKYTIAKYAVEASLSAWFIYASSTTLKGISDITKLLRDDKH